MLDNDKLFYLRERVARCHNLIGAESRLVKGSDDIYGIEFENYQSLVVTVKPIFDMDEDELVALLELMTYGLPMILELVKEVTMLNSEITALVNAVATVAMIASRQQAVETNDLTDKDESTLTVGEK